MNAKRARRGAGLLLVAALVALSFVTATPAAAHVVVVGTTPAADAVLDTAPDRAEVRFDSDLLDIGYAMVVRSADGRTVSTGPVALGRTSIAVAVDPTAGPGRYSVGFRVVSADGHEVTSSFRYTVRGATPTASAPAPSEPVPSRLAGSSAGPSVAAAPDPAPTRWTPTLALVAAVVAVLGAVLLGWALLVGRSRRPGS